MLVQSPENTEDSFRGFSRTERITNDKMEQQQQHLQHIKRLLTTAATATGIVGDVDAPNSTSSPSTSSLPKKGERNLWRMEEIKEMLTIMQETNALDLLNDKMIKSEKVFHDIEKMMFRRGYRKKSHNQIWTKWKFLKSTYMTSRRNGIIPKMIPSEIYLILHKMLGNGSDLTFPLEDDSNNALLEGDEHSNVEEIENSFTRVNESGDCDDGDDDNNLSSVGGGVGGKVITEKNSTFGMAHPIFGFRLGLVKSEPADTGYETTANNSTISENDSLENSIAYPVGLSPQSAHNELKEHSNNSMFEIKTEPDERVTDSPPPLATSSQRSSSPSPDNSLLVPRETASMSIRPLPIQQKKAPTTTRPMPPLRIAPFARETIMTDSLQLNDCPPPLRTINPTRLSSGNIRLNNSHSITNATTTTTNSSSSTTPALAPRTSVLRLPRDITLQLRTDPNRTFPLHQSVAYSLRQDDRPHNINNNNNRTTIMASSRSNSQSQYNRNQQQQDQPMTSQMAKLKSVLLNNKKRRLEIPQWQQKDMPPAPHKKPRIIAPSPNIHNNSSTNIRNNNYMDNRSKHITAEDNDEIDGIDDDDADDDDNIDYDFSVTPQYIPTSIHKSTLPQQQHHQPSAQILSPPKNATSSTPKSTTTKNRTPMEDILKDMAMSLRQSQLQMVNQFFEQQMELARKEHEFQLEQDRLMMLAFKKQTEELMKVAHELFKPNASKNSVAATASKKNTTSKKIVVEKHAKKTTITHEHEDNLEQLNEQDSSQNTELSSSNSENDDSVENADFDPLLSNFDATQFVSSELADDNDNENDNEENNEEESLV